MGLTLSISIDRFLSFAICLLKKETRIAEQKNVHWSVDRLESEINFVLELELQKLLIERSEGNMSYLGSNFFCEKYHNKMDFVVHHFFNSRGI